MTPNLQFERGLPVAVDAERAVLGAILLDNAMFYQAAERLVAEDFALDPHRRIFSRMTTLMAQGRAVDLLTLRELLSKHKELEAVGGIAYLASLTENMPRRVSIEEYVRIVLDKATLRAVVTESSRAITMAADQEDEAEEVLAEAERAFQGIRSRLVLDTLMQAGQISRGLYPGGDYSLFEQTAKETGIPSGLSAYDAMTCGFQRGELTIIAARPSMGKTAWLGNVAENTAVEQKRIVAVFSLEMKQKALLERMYCSRAQVDSDRFRKGGLNDSQRYYVTQARREIDASPLYIDDSSFLSATSIHAKCQNLKQREGLDLVLIDYIGLMKAEASSGRYGNREQEVAATSRALKAMAKDLNVPVVCLSQLNRKNETRTDKRPMLSDLRESGAVEQDADVVAFLHREEYYSREEESLKGKAEIIIAKQRNGPVGVCQFRFSDKALRWADVDAQLFT